MTQRPSYVSIPGSDGLVTRKRGASVAAAVEGAPRSSLARVDITVGEAHIMVGPALLQGPQLALLLDVTDRLAPLLSVESFVVYLQLYRLAVVEGKNACRVGLAELGRRCNLRGRRLNKAIADAVTAGAIVLVDRTRDGTLYRVRWPAEILDGEVTRGKVTAPLASVRSSTKTTTTTTRKPSARPTSAPAKPVAVITAKPATARTKAATATAVTATATKPAATKAAPAPPIPVKAVTATTTAARPPPSTTTARTTPPMATAVTKTAAGGDVALRSVGDVCRWFADRFGGGPGRSGSDVATAVMDLLEAGHTFADMPALFGRFVSAAPATASLRDIERWLTKER